MATDFAEWLQKELDKREMTSADLARLTRKDQGIFSRILRRERKAENETLRAIAKALKIPASVVFIAAGELPDENDVDKWIDEMNHKISLIPVSARKTAEKLLDAFIDDSRDKKK